MEKKQGRWKVDFIYAHPASEERVKVGSLRSSHIQFELTQLYERSDSQSYCPRRRQSRRPIRRARTSASSSTRSAVRWASRRDVRYGVDGGRSTIARRCQVPPCPLDDDERKEPVATNYSTTLSNCCRTQVYTTEFIDLPNSRFLLTLLRMMSFYALTFIRPPLVFTALLFSIVCNSIAMPCN